MIEFVLCEFNGVAFHAGGFLCLLERGNELVGRESGLLEGRDAHVDEHFLNPVAEMVMVCIGLVEDEGSGFSVFGDGGMVGLAFVEGVDIGLNGGGQEGGTNVAVGRSKAPA